MSEMKKKGEATTQKMANNESNGTTNVIDLVASERWHLTENTRYRCNGIEFETSGKYGEGHKDGIAELSDTQKKDNKTYWRVTFFDGDSMTVSYLTSEGIRNKVAAPSVSRRGCGYLDEAGLQTKIIATVSTVEKLVNDLSKYSVQYGFTVIPVDMSAATAAITASLTAANEAARNKAEERKNEEKRVRQERANRITKNISDSELLELLKFRGIDLSSLTSQAV